MRVTSCLLGLGVLCLQGCFLFHSTSDEDVADDRIPVDAGTRVDSAVAVIDAGASDAGACRPVQAVVQACVEGDPAAFIEPGYRLWVDDCHCDGELRCDLLERREGDPPTARLQVSVCNEGFCLACTGPREVFCPLPEGGPHTVVHRASGSSGGAGDFPHFAMGHAPGDGTLCQSVGSSGGGLCSFPGSPWAPDEVCTTSSAVAEGERVALKVRGDVSCALEPGPCDAVLDDTTGVITLQPRLRSCDEGSPTWDCTGGTGILEQTCWTPPLTTGRTYPVRVDGRLVAELTVGTPVSDACTSLR